MALGLCQGKIRRLHARADLDQQLLQEQGLGVARGLQGEIRLVDGLQPLDEAIEGEARRALEQIEGTEGIHLEELRRRAVIPVPRLLQAGKHAEAERIEGNGRLQRPVQPAIQRGSGDDQVPDLSRQGLRLLGVWAT